MKPFVNTPVSVSSTRGRATTRQQRPKQRVLTTCARSPLQAMTEALDILSQLLQLSAPPNPYNDTRESAFVLGSCALHFAYADTFKVRERPRPCWCALRLLLKHAQATD